MIDCVDFVSHDRFPAISCARRYRNLYVTKSGIALNGLRLVPESVQDNHDTKQFYRYAVFKRLISKTVRLSDDHEYFFIHKPWARGYHHWLIESLMRLAALKLDVRENLQLVIPEDYPQFAFESLDGLISEDQIVRLPAGAGAILPRTLVVANPLYKQFDAISIGNLRLSLMEAQKVEHQIAKPTRKIYISRELASMRKVENEQEVQAWMRQRGFEIVHTENLSFRDQILLFQQTAEVASVHGAALTNLIFMQPWTQVHEFCRLPEPGLLTRNPCFERLAEAAKVNFDVHYFPPGKNLAKCAGRANIIVDVQMLQSLFLNQK